MTTFQIIALFNEHFYITQVFAVAPCIYIPSVRVYITIYVCICILAAIE